MKTVFLYAYDRVNLGDDLFIHMITKRYSAAQFYLWTRAENRDTFRELPNLKVLAWDSSWMHALEKLPKNVPGRIKRHYEKAADAVVYIGGSIFIEYPAWRNMLNWWNYAAERYPFYVLGANFGPYSSEEYRAGLDQAMAKMRDVCFRDRYSVSCFPDNPRVRYAPDILFACPMPKPNAIKKQVFVSVIDCARKDAASGALNSVTESYVSGLSSLVEHYARDGYSVVLSSFCQAEGDEEAETAILANIPEEFCDCCSLLNYHGNNAEEIKAAIADSEYVLATRFHAVILALAAGRPVYPLIYSDKTIHVLEDCGFTGAYLDIRKEKDYDYETSRKNLNNELGVKIEELIRASEGHFRELDKVLS